MKKTDAYTFGKQVPFRHTKPGQSVLAVEDEALVPVTVENVVECFNVDDERITDVRVDLDRVEEDIVATLVVIFGTNVNSAVVVA